MNAAQRRKFVRPFKAQIAAWRLVDRLTGKRHNGRLCHEHYPDFYMATMLSKGYALPAPFTKAAAMSMSDDVWDSLTMPVYDEFAEFKATAFYDLTGIPPQYLTQGVSR